MERESEALADWLDAFEGVTFVSSALAEVELPRAIRRTEPDLIGNVPALLEQVARYEIDELVRRTAASYLDSDLRALDAIHLATAQAVFGRQLEWFVTYDKRLRASAEKVGLNVARPGDNAG